MNPIYIEFYPHERADCYKINLPWTKYAKSTMVLCKVSEGYEKAKEIAARVIKEHLEEVIKVEPEKEFLD